MHVVDCAQPRRILEPMTLSGIFLFTTFLPFLRASDRPIAIACFLLVTLSMISTAEAVKTVISFSPAIYPKPLRLPACLQLSIRIFCPPWLQSLRNSFLVFRGPFPLGPTWRNNFS